MVDLNGRTIADLVLEINTDLTDVWFINRCLNPWSPEPLRLLPSHTILWYLQIEDAIYELGVSIDQ